VHCALLLGLLCLCCALLQLCQVAKSQVQGLRLVVVLDLLHKLQSAQSTVRMPCLE
jgi:hypothetical protein